MKTSTILKRALAKIKKGWTQRVYAANKKDVVVSLYDSNATKFCIDGAVARVVGNYESDEVAYSYLRRSLPSNSNKNLCSWNDNKRRTKKQVIALFEKAIKLALKEGK